MQLSQPPSKEFLITILVLALDYVRWSRRLEENLPTYSPFTKACNAWPRHATMRTGVTSSLKGMSFWSSSMLGIKFNVKCQLMQQKSGMFKCFHILYLPSSVPQIVCGVFGCVHEFKGAPGFDWSITLSRNVFLIRFPLQILVSFFWFLVFSWIVLRNNLLYTINR